MRTNHTAAVFLSLSALASLFFVVPFVVSAETAYDGAYVPCGNLDYQSKDLKTGTMQGTKDSPIPDGIVDNPCNFNHIVTLAQRLILAWIMAGVTIAALGFAYAGLLYITAMGSQEKISHAHSIFIKTFFGFVFMLSAWLIAKTMESIFLTPEMQQRSYLYTTPKATR